MADWLKATATDVYFDNVGLAAAGLGSCPRLESFQLGYGLVDEAQTPPVLTALTGAETSVPGVVHSGSKTEGNMVVTYSGGTLLIQCIIPAGAIGDPEKVCVCGIFDQNDELAAIVTFYPDWITPSEEYRINVSIVFPHS